MKPKCKSPLQSFIAWHTVGDQRKLLTWLLLILIIEEMEVVIKNGSAVTHYYASGAPLTLSDSECIVSSLPVSIQTLFSIKQELQCYCIWTHQSRGHSSCVPSVMYLRQWFIWFVHSLQEIIHHIWEEMTMTKNVRSIRNFRRQSWQWVF